MKKNLKIVSATAAALLAVAPVAASTISTVNADDINSIIVGGASTPIPKDSDVQIGSTVSGVTTKDGSGYTNGRVTGSITASYKGTNYSADFSSTDAGVNISNGTTTYTKDNIDSIVPGSNYTVTLPNVIKFNFGSQNANKEINLQMPKNVELTGLYSENQADGVTETNAEPGKTLKVKTNQSGVVTFNSANISNVKVVETSDIRGVAFYNLETGSIVTKGDLTVNAGDNARMNVQQIVNAFNNKYQAAQLNNVNDKSNTRLTDNNAKAVAKMLRDQNISVDDQGYFTAPSTFDLTFHAVSTENNSTAELPVTVTVPNGKDATPATEPSQSTQIMYKSAVYDKDGKNTGKTIAGYEYKNLVTENGSLKEYTINGDKFYKIAGEESYVRTRNVTGTKMTLKKNAYEYKSNGKRANKKTVKKGTEVTVYGDKYKAIKGYKGDAVRVGVNKYIKLANVNYTKVN